MTERSATPPATGADLEAWMRRAMTTADAAADLVVCAAGDGDAVARVLEHVARAVRRIRPSGRPLFVTPPSGGPACPPAWTEAPLADADAWVRLESPLDDRGLLVPRLCLRPSVWVTIAAVCADARFGLRTPFTAHLEILAAANPAIAWPRLACEVFRSWPPDLAVACLPRPAGAGEPGVQALADTRVDRLETVLAALAGVRTSDLPHWREVAAHFAIAAGERRAPGSGAAVARLSCDLAGTRAAAARAHRREAVARGLENVRRSVANLRRVPDFLRRRLEAAREGSA